MPTSPVPSPVSDALRLGWLREDALLGLYERQLNVVVEVQEAAMDGHWEDLRLASMACLGLGELGLDYLMALADARVDRRRAAREDAERLVAHFAALLENGDVASVVDQLGGNLTPDNRAELEEILSAIASGSSDVADLGSLAPSPLVFDLRRQLLALTNLCRVRGLMGLTQAEFQSAYASLEERSPSVPAKRMAAAVRVHLEAFEGDLSAGQQRIRTLLGGGDATAVRTAIRELCATVRVRAPRLAAVLAEGRSASEELLEAGAGGAAEELGAELVHGAFALRRAIATAAAGARVAVELDEPESPDEVSAVIVGDQPSFDYSIEDGKNTPIAHLADAEEDQLVDIEGFVDEMRVTRLGGQMLVTEIVLLDPSSETRASAAATFVNGPNIGITPGAYCRVTGRFTESSNLLDDGPGVEVERLDLADASRESWLLAFLRLADPWFHIWRNSLGLSWSLGPGAGDESDSSDHFRGAGEIVFLPLVRKEGLE